MKFEKLVQFKKRAGVQQITEGAVYIPGVPDTHGDRASAEVIAAMAHEFNGAGLAKNVDVEHDGKACGSIIIESSIAKQDSELGPAGSWIVAMKHPDAVWQRIEKGDLAMYSMYGVGQRAESSEVSMDGKPVRDILNAKISAISLVRRGANRTGFISKSDTPAWAQALIDSNKALAARVDSQAAKLAELEKRRSGGNVTALRKAEDEADANRNVRIAQLRKRHAQLSERLEALWENPSLATGSGRSARAAENDLVIEIHKTEQELAALGEQSRVGDSAFKFRGGQSYTVDCGAQFPLGDSYYEARPADDDLDLGSLLKL
jgi:hypothetical protein